MNAWKDVWSMTQTKVGLVFAIVVPLLFLVVWMTGYQGTTERLDQLNVGVVGEANDPFIKSLESAPFTVQAMATEAKGLEALDASEVDLVLHKDDATHQLTAHVSQTNAEFANAILERATETISKQLNGEQAFTTSIVTEHAVTDFALSMLPLVLGFVIYIAAMTMGIQFNLVSTILKSRHTKWNLFWSRQLLHGIVLLVVPLLLISMAHLLTDITTPFLNLWAFEVLVVATCIAVTQMNFAIFGPIAPLVNVALIPFQLMTAGNIVPAKMLAPFYQSLGTFLPVPNAVSGFGRLLFMDGSVGAQVLHLSFLFVGSMLVTCLLTATKKEQMNDELVA
ncbi:YhgE/Pip domain-containing protein [Exiguobacterium sp. TDN 0502]|uniref:YhgE/Pip domain-containing protein n=1 Tax=Exiguobacterium sp. TDN 0502 TaxID=3420731 RepID=UPI003D776BE8